MIGGSLRSSNHTCRRHGTLNVHLQKAKGLLCGKRAGGPAALG